MQFKIPFPHPRPVANTKTDAIDDSSNADADIDNIERANITESDVDGDAAAESADAAADAAERAASWAATDCATNWVLLQKIFSHLPHGGLGKAAQVLVFIIIIISLNSLSEDIIYVL